MPTTLPSLNLVTRVSRPENLVKVKNSVFPCKEFEITWNLIIDTDAVKELESTVLQDISSAGNINLSFVQNQNDYLHTSMSELIDTIDDSWIYILDDDNLIYEDFYNNLSQLIASNNSVRAFVFNQFIDGKDFTGHDFRIAHPDNMVRSRVDSAQICFHTSIFNEYIPPVYIGDSIFIENLYKENKDKFYFVDKTLCYYNRLSSSNSTFHLPKVLYIGNKEEEFNSLDHLGYFDTRLKVKRVENDREIGKEIASFKPNSIITDANDPLSYQELSKQPYEIRRKWYNCSSEENIGDAGYNVAMNSMLSKSSEVLVSFFTPAYNTKDKLYNTYKSLTYQTYNNWEWVIVNDSNDGNRTLRIIEEIAAYDPRVKVYDFRDKTGGIIGEAKYRAAVLTSGDILAELDHDDYLTENCAEDLVKAYKKYPECGFYYGDSVEVFSDMTCPRYPEGYCFGYGEYYKHEWNGYDLDVALTPNINPITIRHIVGVPNHIRAWRRDVYFEIGGHNRELTIADDYELIVRTFLSTIFCRIPKLTYLQFIYNDETGTNTHETSRADIQRRVFTIQNHYNEAIKERFEELGLVDWAYEYSPSNPLEAPIRKDKQEQRANIIWTE